VFDPLRDFFLTFGTTGLLLWTVLKILAIALPVIVAVAFYVLAERKVIGLDARTPRAAVRRPHLRHRLDPGLRRRVQDAVQGTDHSDQLQSLPVPAGADPGARLRRWRPGP
jgi:hypothetical protein